MISDRNKNNSITVSEIIQQSHVYPYGMSMSGSWDNTLKHDYQYKRLGGERQEEFGLDWDMHPYRAYNGGLGVWSSVEPLADYFSSYSTYSANGLNPLKYIDPLGLDWFRNEETGEEYWEDRTEANDGEKHLGAFHLVRGRTGYVLHHQNKVLGSVTVSDGTTDDMYADIGEEGFSRLSTLADHVDPFVGLGLMQLSKSLGKELQYHSFTTGEGFERSLKRVNDVKTPFGSIKASTAYNLSKTFVIGSYVINGISILNYLEDINSGRVNKGVTGLAVMAATPQFGVVYKK